MEDIKKLHRQFLVTIVTFIFVIAIIITIISLSFIKISNPNTPYLIFFSLMLVFMFLTTMFKSRIDSIINTSYLLKITQYQGKPLGINRLYSEENLRSYLNANDYIDFEQKSNHAVFYKTTKDHIKKIFRGYILEIVVYIKPDESEFYLEAVDEEINKIQEILIKNKQRVDKMLITQIKIIDELDDVTKAQLSEIVFIRAQSGIISTINVGIDLKSSKAVLLYSDDFSPSLYYTYHVEQIKKMI